MTSFNGEVREEQKPLCEKYKISIKSNLGMGNFGFKNGTIEEIYSPDDLKDDMDEVDLTKRLEKHRASGKSLIAKLANGDGVIMISPSSQYTISVGEWGENPGESSFIY